MTVHDWAWVRLIASIVIFVFFVAASAILLWRYRNV